MKHTYSKFQSSLPLSYHHRIISLTKDLNETPDHIPLPGLELLYDPLVRLEVEKFLGPNFTPDTCRHIHWNWGTANDRFHQDLYDEKPWPEKSKYIMLFYYPQDTPPNLGPTEIIDHDGTPYLMSGPAGTCFLMTPNTWHRATANLTLLTPHPRPRLMIRNLFKSLEPVCELNIKGK